MTDVIVNLTPLLQKLTAAKKRALHDLAEESKELFQRQTSTWSTGHSVVITEGDDSATIELLSNVPARARVPLASLISDDIKKVHGVMTDPFSPKTAPGRIDASPGVGGLLRVSRTPIAGKVIRGRHFDLLNADNLRKKAKAIVDKAYQQELI